MMVYRKGASVLNWAVLVERFVCKSVMMGVCKGAHVRWM